MARSRHGIVSAAAASDLTAAMAAVAEAPAEVRRLIRDTARQQLTPAWGQELAKRPAYNDAQEKFVTEGHVAEPFNSGIALRTGSATLSKSFEFGTKDQNFTRTLRTRGGKSFTRHTRRQMPPFRKSGWIAWPAANKFGNRAMRMWAQIAVKVTHDWMEGKR